MGERKKQTCVMNQYGTLSVGVDNGGPYIELECCWGTHRWRCSMEVVDAIEADTHLELSEEDWVGLDKDDAPRWPKAYEVDP